jgi:hypothetical protein
MVRFVCVSDAGVPSTTTDLLAAACRERSVEYVAVHASAFGFDPAERAQPGDLLYRPSVTSAAMLVEQYLHGPGVATFYADDDPFITVDNPVLRFERAGLPVPRSHRCGATTRDVVLAQVDDVGGFPVVVKVSGYEGGVGVIVVETARSLFSLLDYLWAQRIHPLLTSFIDDATHWRVVVVGDRAVAAYRNTTEVDDFRTFAEDDAALYTDHVDPVLAQLAVGAAKAIGRETAGVDILGHPSGRLYLLEANFPCYFAQAQTVAAIDIAGAMLDHLMAKRLAFGI